MAIVNKRLNRIEHVGMVLHIRGTFRMDTSMDEVMIWDPIKKTHFTEYIMGDTWAEVDASEEVKEAYRKSILDLADQVEAHNKDAVLKSIRIGSEVKVVRGRKVPKGKVGVVKALSNNQFGESVLLDDGTWVSAKNINVNYKGKFIEPETYHERTFFFRPI